MQRFGIYGASGRMGQAIQSFVKCHDAFQEIEIIPLEKSITFDALQAQTIDGILDFSSCDGLHHLLEILLIDQAKPFPLLVGTTGLSFEVLKKIEDYSLKAPVMLAPNTSLGANLLIDLAGKVALFLKQKVDVDIVETHHVLKKDKPSGTALKIKESVEKGLGQGVSVHSIRSQQVIGTHTVIFQGQYDRLEITHQALSRDLFAEGALDMMIWLHQRSFGLYKPFDYINHHFS